MIAFFYALHSPQTLNVLRRSLHIGKDNLDDTPLKHIVLERIPDSEYGILLIWINE